MYYVKWLRIWFLRNSYSPTFKSPHPSSFKTCYHTLFTSFTPFLPPSLPLSRAHACMCFSSFFILFLLVVELRRRNPLSLSQAALLHLYICRSSIMFWNHHSRKDKHKNTPFRLHGPFAGSNLGKSVWRQVFGKEFAICKSCIFQCSGRMYTRTSPPSPPCIPRPPLAHLYIPYSLPISAGEMLQDSNKCLCVARGGRRGQAQSIKSLRDYGVAMTSRLLKIIGLFCKRAF